MDMTNVVSTGAPIVAGAAGVLLIAWVREKARDVSREENKDDRELADAKLRAAFAEHSEKILTTMNGRYAQTAMVDARFTALDREIKALRQDVKGIGHDEDLLREIRHAVRHSVESIVSRQDEDA